ncbi:MAG: hypothetical protein CR984_04170 [Proteobacteria bacterium]|nr:MAG: hypothetical protein CR984_04170 [Pseudomonadota bacterium]PIE67856.1 MAG: hypothetical protein CSA23_01890 [Deltaproteobacteria bacterium]
MFGIGMPEMILILAVALIVIGPQKLPDLAKSLGKAMGEFKKATRDLKESIQIDTEFKEVKRTFDDLAKDTPATIFSDTDKWKPPAEAASGEKYLDEATAGPTPSAGDAMDRVNKDAFDRHNDESVEAARDASAGKINGDAESRPETNKG